MYFENSRVYISENLFYTVSRVKGRLVFAPCQELKKEQRYFLNAIKWGYKLKMSTLEAAKIHAGYKWVLKMDIKDFYSSVPQTQIEKFVKDVCNHINSDKLDTGVIQQVLPFKKEIYYFNLVTINGKLPTGAPTSAHIANACFRIVSRKIKQICQIYNVNYSRYMDDLTFSCNSKDTLKKIEKRLLQILNSNGYKINPKKTKYISDNKRQEILGLVVNGNKTRISNDLKRKIRAMIYNSYKIKANPTEPAKCLNAYVNETELNGYLSYIKDVDKEYYKKLQKYIVRVKNRKTV